VALVELIQRSEQDDGPAGDAATHALASAPFSHRQLEFVVNALLNLAADTSLSAERRGQAAEGVGNHLEHSKRRKLVRRASLQLINHLDDPVPDVRFWSAFSLGKLRARRARKQLQVLSADGTVVPRWWAVGNEAADALATINRVQRPDDDDHDEPVVETAHQPDRHVDVSENRDR
jgi:hypothetical protein